MIDGSVLTEEQMHNLAGYTVEILDGEKVIDYIKCSNPKDAANAWDWAFTNYKERGYSIHCKGNGTFLSRAELRNL